MIHLTKDNDSPETLVGNDADVELSRLEQIVDDGEKPTYKDFNAGIYGADDVRKQLLIDQHEKCAYCECTLLDKDGGEVEHFRPKTAYRQDRVKGNTKKPAYYKLAYNWNNLLLSCHACNSIKSTFFPLANPEHRFDLVKELPLLINPYNDDPANHLEFRQEKVFPVVDGNGKKDEKGSKTIEYIDLNRKDLVERRRRVLYRFVRTMSRLGMSFEQFLQQEIQDEISDGRTAESIEFYGMLANQKYKF